MSHTFPQRIAFDATHLSRLSAGVSTFILNQLEALYDLPAPRWSLSVIAKTDQIDDIRERLPRADLIPVAIPSTAYRIAWEQLALPRLLEHHGIDLLHSPHYSVPLNTRTARVVTIHDLSYILMPERHRRSRRWFFRYMIPRATRVADHVFCVSECTRRDLLDLYPYLAAEKISVVPLGVDPRLRQPVSAAARTEVQHKYKLANHFVLHVGTIEPRKNIGTAIDALRILRTVYPDVELVLVGQPGWESDTMFETIRHTAGVRHLGHVPAADLPALYRAATALVMPSHYEGFGLPVLEAMALGTPVVSSGKGSLAEVGEDAVLVPRDDTADAYAASLGEIIESPALRAALRDRGQIQANKFSWTAAAVRTAAAYEQVLTVAGRGRPAAKRTT